MGPGLWRAHLESGSGLPVRVPGELWAGSRGRSADGGPQGGVSRALPCRFLGTSGQNVSDIFRYSSMEDHLEILEWTLQVRHVSPTAPDTLGTGTQTVVWSKGPGKAKGAPAMLGGFPAWICTHQPSRDLSKEKPQSLVCLGSYCGILRLFVAKALLRAEGHGSTVGARAGQSTAPCPGAHPGGRKRQQQSILPCLWGHAAVFGDVFVVAAATGSRV